MAKSENSNESDSNSSSNSGSSRSRDHKRRKISKSHSEKKEKPQVIVSPAIICIRNISRNVTKNHLIEIFGNFGKIKKVDIPIDEKTQKIKDYAYVEYETKNECDEALVYMNEGQIDGKILKIEYMNVELANKAKEKKNRRSKTPIKKITNSSNKGHRRDRNFRKKENGSNDIKRKKSRSRSNRRRDRSRSQSRNRNRGRRLRTKSRSHSKRNNTNNAKKEIKKDKIITKKEESSSRSSSKSSSSLDSSSRSSSSSVNRSKSNSKK